MASLSFKSNVKLFHTIRNTIPSPQHQSDAITPTSCSPFFTPPNFDDLRVTRRRFTMNMSWKIQFIFEHLYYSMLHRLEAIHTFRNERAITSTSSQVFHLNLNYLNHTLFYPSIPHIMQIYESGFTQTT